MPKLNNEAARRSAKNFSIEDRVYDMIVEQAKGGSKSEVVNSILKEHFGIIN